MLVAVAALALAMSGWLAAAPALAQTVPDAPTGPAARTVAVYTVTLEVARLGHLAETGLHQQGLELVHPGPEGDGEEADELARHALRAGPPLAGPLARVLHQLAAEAAPHRRHESSVLPLKRSYISTMKRLDSRESGPEGRAPKRKTGSARTYWKARSIS